MNNQTTERQVQHLRQQLKFEQAQRIALEETLKQTADRIRQRSCVIVFFSFCFCCYLACLSFSLTCSYVVAVLLFRRPGRRSWDRSNVTPGRPVSLAVASATAHTATAAAAAGSIMLNGPLTVPAAAAAGATAAAAAAAGSGSGIGGGQSHSRRHSDGGSGGHLTPISSAATMLISARYVCLSVCLSCRDLICYCISL